MGHGPCEDRQGDDLGGNGYPCLFTATAKHLLPQIIAERPGAHLIWTTEAGDIITEEWEGRTVIDHSAVKACRPGEWLLVVAWDES